MMEKIVSVYHSAVGGMAPEPSLEDLLLQLDKYGKPHVFRSDRGWHVSVEMSVMGAGIRFEVKSEFNHATPSIAAKVCVERVYLAIKKIELPGR